MNERGQNRLWPGAHPLQPRLQVRDADLQALRAQQQLEPPAVEYFALLAAPLALAGLHDAAPQRTVTAGPIAAPFTSRLTAAASRQRVQYAVAAVSGA